METAAADLVRNVIVADLRMPPGNQMDGISTALRIRRRQPAVGDRPAVGGTDGIAYLLKERAGDPDKLVGAVRSVAERESVIDPDVVAAMVAGHGRPWLADLTGRERDVLRG